LNPSRSTLLKKAAGHSGVHNITLTGYPLQFAYRMKVTTDKCANSILPVAYYYYRRGENVFEDRFIEDATHYKIKFFMSDATPTFNTIIYSNPDCPVTVQISVDILETLGQLVRFNVAPILSSIVAIALFALSIQIANGMSQY
jgi:hypothetical protein